MEEHEDFLQCNVLNATEFLSPCGWACECMYVIHGYNRAVISAAVLRFRRPHGLSDLWHPGDGGQPRTRKCALLRNKSDKGRTVARLRWSVTASVYRLGE